MIDCRGKPVIIGWQEHELVWLEAALSLDRDEHTAAFKDIANRTGRTLAAVQSKGYQLQAALCEARFQFRQASQRRALMPGSQIPAPSEKQLMGAR